MQHWLFLLFPVLIWGVLRIVLPNQKWDWDFDQTHATFTIMLSHLLKVAGVMVVGDVLLALYGKHTGGGVMSIGACLAGALYGIGFVVWMLTKYEMYLHARYPRNGGVSDSPYTTSEYAMTRALGYGMVMYTVIGLVSTVIA